MTVTEVTASKVFSTIQSLASGQRLVACDFRKGELLDTAGMTIDYITRIASQTDSTKFFKVTED